VWGDVVVATALDEDELSVDATPFTEQRAGEF
jgi:hypothetical protein